MNTPNISQPTIDECLVAQDLPYARLQRDLVNTILSRAFHTSRLTLYPLTLLDTEDRDLVEKIRQDFALVNSNFFVAPQTPEDTESERAFLASEQEAMRHCSKLVYTITRQDDPSGAIIGLAGMHSYSHDWEKTEWGIWLHPEFHGKWFAKEVFDVIARIARECGADNNSVILHRVAANNTPSIALACALGGKKVAEWVGRWQPKSQVYAIEVKHHWNPQ